MKKRMTLLLLLSLIASIFVASAPVMADDKTPDGQFRVGMETAYAPFNWTQTNDKHGAVPKSGDKGAFAGGYDVEIAKRIAEEMGRELVIVPTQWDGLVPALQSGKIDAIIAGMSPTEERRQQIDFTDAYYESHLVIVTRKNGDYADATSIKDFAGAKVTGQLNTFHYSVVSQIPDVIYQAPMKDFSAMRVALDSGIIDGYVTERPEGVTATSVNDKFEMIEFNEADGFQTNPEDVQIAVGMRKNDPLVQEVNQILAGISAEERTTLMDQAIQNQPSANQAGISAEERTNLMDEAIQNQPSANQEEEASTFASFKKIIDDYGMLFLKGAGLTLFIAIFSTIAGTIIGLLVGVFRTIPMSDNPVTRFFQKLGDLLLTIYIEVFRGTPMMVQAMVIFYGLALAFGIDLNRTVAALLIVSINTGAYMSEIVRGGIFAVDRGQFEAAQAIGMTHSQTMGKVVLPQVIRNILPAIGNETVINIKDTAVLSVISVADLFFQGTAAAGTNYQFFQTFLIVGVIYLVMTITATRLLRLMEKKMDGPSAYVKVEEVVEGQE